jgi:hypothetical protein
MESVKMNNYKTKNYEEYSNLMETDDIFRCGELNPNISSNYIWKLFRPLALPLVGVTTPQFKLN